MYPPPPNRSRTRLWIWTEKSASHCHSPAFGRIPVRYGRSFPIRLKRRVGQLSAVSHCVHLHSYCRCPKGGAIYLLYHRPCLHSEDVICRISGRTSARVSNRDCVDCTGELTEPKERQSNSSFFIYQNRARRLVRALFRELILLASGRLYGFLALFDCLYLLYCHGCFSFSKIPEQR